eukprot:3813244-Rhodomonas_salina.2
MQSPSSPPHIVLGRPTRIAIALCPLDTMTLASGHIRLGPRLAYTAKSHATWQGLSTVCTVSSSLRL